MKVEAPTQARVSAPEKGLPRRNCQRCLFPTNAFCGRDRVRCRSSRAAMISSKIVPSFSGSVSIEAAAVSSSQVFLSRFGLSLSVATSFRRAAAF
jgi:hypothetical protein